MRILVCGGRDFTDKKFVYDSLYSIISIKYPNWIHNPPTIIHGAANGIDSIADEWANDNWLTVDDYPANWKKYGKAAGPIRNQQMLDEGKPDLVVAFPGDRGTANMIEQARKAGIEVIEIAYLRPVEGDEGV